MNEPLVGSLTTPLQFGMAAALEQDDPAPRRASLAKRRIAAAEILNASGFNVEPVAGGMFYFLDISATGMDGDEFADALLAEEHVAVVPGSGFGLAPEYQPDGRVVFEPNDLARRCVRLCFGVPEELLAEGVKRMAAFIKRHGG
jgi:aspartate/methionine/tyrosine aminotransferase